MKYIDAEKLRSVLQNTINSMKEKDAKGERYDAFLNGKLSICEELLGCIDSLQQEQTPTEHEIAEAHRYAEMIRERDKARTQQEQPDADLEKASRHVYESWNGGTMDDVRRDMVELGKVLNVRKEK